MEQIKVCFYKENDWPKLKKFIQNYWGKKHPFTKKKLFDWQFKGFEKKIKSIVLKNQKKIIGFRGLIPGYYQIKDNHNLLKIVRGAESAIWTIDKKYRNKGLGKVMNDYILNKTDVFFGARSFKNTSLRLYKKSKFNVINETPRYIISLDYKRYLKIIKYNKFDINNYSKWFKKQKITSGIQKPKNIDFNKLADLWKKNTFSLKIESIYRNKNFWEWRYKKSKGFRYIFFGNPIKSMVIIARLEKISSNIDDLDDKFIFRIIEIIPFNKKTWCNSSSIKDLIFFNEVLNWAKLNNCIAADFYFSSKRFNHLLVNSGFKIQKNHSKDHMSLSQIFNPLNFDYEPLNFFYKINSEKLNTKKRNINNVYIVKSIADMDRPIKN